MRCLRLSSTFLHQHPNVNLFQDNARLHSSKLTGDYPGQNNVDILPWPAYSPDLSLAVHLWDHTRQAGKTDLGVLSDRLPDKI